MRGRIHLLWYTKCNGRESGGKVFPPLLQPFLHFCKSVSSTFAPAPVACGTRRDHFIQHWLLDNFVRPDAAVESVRENKKMVESVSTPFLRGGDRCWSGAACHYLTVAGAHDVSTRHAPAGDTCKSTRCGFPWFHFSMDVTWRRFECTAENSSSVLSADRNLPSAPSFIAS